VRVRPHAAQAGGQPLGGRHQHGTGSGSSRTSSQSELAVGVEAYTDVNALSFILRCSPGRRLLLARAPAAATARTRTRIALEAARRLFYLHHDCTPATTCSLQGQRPGAPPSLSRATGALAQSARLSAPLSRAGRRRRARPLPPHARRPPPPLHSRAATAVGRRRRARPLPHARRQPRASSV
jgi:hypothetical protein